MLELKMNFIADSFMTLSGSSLLTVLVPRQGIEILLVANFLLLLRNVDSSKILLKLTFVDTVLILNILQSNLSFFLQFSKLIKVLEDKMLTSLLINFLLDLMFFS